MQPEIANNNARSDAYVHFDNVQKSYDGETLVVRDLNLEIARGEFLTMLGPSGSGKTTCLMMLAGFEPATHGEIVLDGESINNVPPHKRDIGMVFQNYALFPHMTVRENLSFPLQVRGRSTSDTESQVTKVLDMVQLGEFGDRRPAQLSGGQQQRVAVARALVFEPKLVLMDEPLGALDKQLRDQMQYEIKRIHETLGVTVVYVTHDQSEALTMSDRVAVFNDGVIQQLAPPSQLYEEPENAFVAQFIGENNTLNGTIDNIEGDRCGVTLDSGERIVAKTVNNGGAGTRTVLSLRPERVKVLTEKSNLENQVQARVEELIYLGDHIRTRMSVANQDDFIVKIPNSSNHAQLQPGNTISIGWRARDCHAMDTAA